MGQLEAVRAEIKCWERDFAATHGRDPDVDDIRGQPRIADKYKLYKRLSKAALPAPKSRPAESVPLPGFNPFSPVKKSRRPETPRPRTSPPSHAHPVPTTAVSRARKRLRGEPVSPTPNKPKRQRVPSRAVPSPDSDSSDGEHESDHQLPQCQFTSSFVDDSPVKAPAGGKSFKLLFDDALPALSVHKRLFSPSAGLGPADLSVPTSLKPHQSSRPPSEPQHRASRVQANLSAQRFPTKGVPPHKPLKPVAFQLSYQKTSSKRALDTSDPASSQSQLIPPSPPPQYPTNRDSGKGKGKATASRKKSRVEDQESDQSAVSPDDMTLKIATVSPDHSKHRPPDDLDWDPSPHHGIRDHEPTADEQIDPNRHAPGTFSVDLPDKFRRVLAISPPRNRNSTEERVVHGLLYGHRVGHYHPSKGGDIWDAGEMDEGALGDAETEDDWEGEPVPWEVGEL